MTDQISTGTGANINVEKKVDIDALMGTPAPDTTQEAAPTEDTTDEVETEQEVPEVQEQEEAEEVESHEGSEDVEREEEEGKSERVEDTTNDESEDINLNELFLEVDGQELAVDTIIAERNTLKAQFDAIAKDEFLKGFIEHYMTTGNADDYLQAKAVNYDKIDDLDLLRRQFEQQNSDLDPKTVEKMWKRKIASDYLITPDLTPEDKESDDYEIAQSILKRDAQRARNEFKDRQSKFKTPEPKVAEQQQAPQKFDADAYRTNLLKTKEVDTFSKDGLLPLAIKSDNGDVFGYEASDPKQIIEMMVYDRNFWKQLWNDKTKTVDRTKQAKVYAYAANPDAFEQTLVEHGRTLEREDRLKDAKNVDGRLSKKTTAAQTSDSDWKAGFLKSALQQKKR